LRALGVRDAIVTLGREGALVSTGDDTVEVPALPVQAVDTTAAGDAFCGGLAVGLARGDDLIEAARFAARVAALAVTKAGAQDSMPTLAEVESLAAGARP
jgi:ribokinase